jgi:hypothetical protein
MSSTTLAATAAIGLAVVGLAYQYSKQDRDETGREPWNDGKDVNHYDYIILGGNQGGSTEHSLCS